MTDHGRFHWNELMTRDVDKAKNFYGKTLGWTFNDLPMPPDGTYTLCMAGETMVGGMFLMQGPEHEHTPECWFAYIAVDDVDKRVEIVKAEGGQVLRDPFDVPHTGRIAIIADSNGSAVGYMTPSD